MDVLRIIERKKRGEELSAAEIEGLVAGFAAGEVPRYQMSAFLMATWFNGMSPGETVGLTGAMLRSGSELDVSGLGGPTADKHSTGGVGDKVSLLLAPLAAACGLKVPMLSGRGLGHTGGTLDKLEAIPGYRINLTNEEFLGTVGEVGCAIIGQSADIAPADGRIYALRDVTATVDCVPLITASILSKKLAAGPRTIVIDLKTGSGAFMTDLEQARALAVALRDTAAHWDRRVSVVFSDMSQPLGRAVGHANETVEAFAAMRPGGRESAPADLVALTEELVAEMVAVARLEPDHDAALARGRQAWDGGDAFAMLARWIVAQGGRIDAERDDFGLEIAPPILEVPAPSSGFVGAVVCREVGLAVADMGGGRRKVEDRLDLTAGLDFLVEVGQRVEAGQPLATLRCRDRGLAEQAERRLASAVEIVEEAVESPPLVLERLGPIVA